MEEKNIYTSLIKRWKELKAKLPVAQTLMPSQPYQLSYVSPEELIELEDVGRKLSKNCWDELSPTEKFEIDREKFLKTLK